MALDHVVKHIDKNEFNASQIPCLPCYCFPCPALSPPPPLLPLPHHASPHHLTLLLFIIVSILGVCFLFVSYYTIFSKFCWYRNRRTTPPQTEVNGSHEEFLDENHPTLIDHPIWFITTVGLDQPTITSITVFKYKKEEGVVEGSDCSVCLSEFQEDESLRLLPKCSHAFHLPCIDTWLRSHTNCPLCRAPIVSVANSSVRESNSNGSGSREETQIESSVGDGEVRRDVSEEVAEEERVLQEVRNDCEIGKGCEFQMLDKVLDGDRVVEDEVQSVRRSVSMDSSILCSPASVIVVPVEGEASSSAEVVEEKDIGLIGNCSSSGKSIWKGAVSMTRSISAGGKLLSSKSSKCRGSILPLNPSDMRQNGSGVSLIGDFNRSNKLVLHGKIEDMLKFLGESNNHWIIKGEL